MPLSVKVLGVVIVRAAAKKLRVDQFVDLFLLLVDSLQRFGEVLFDGEQSLSEHGEGDFIVFEFLVRFGLKSEQFCLKAF